VVAAAAAAGITLIAGASPAGAAANRLELEHTRLTGRLTFTWAGNPAGGCMAAGVCGVSGSLTLIPNRFGEIEAPSPLPEPLFLLLDPQAVARVVTDDADGARVSTCTDVVDTAVGVLVTFVPGGAGAVFPRAGAVAPPSSGRCAGPTAADLARARLPAIPSGSHDFELAGRMTYDAGPFAITEDSTLKGLTWFTSLGIGPGGSGPGAGGSGGGPGFPSGGPPTGKPHPHHVLVEHARVVYRIVAVSGRLKATFGGTPRPQCVPLGSCGVAGSIGDSLALSGAVAFYGSRRVRARAPARRALGDLFAGRLGLHSRLTASRLRLIASERSTGPAGTHCEDTSAGTRLRSYSSRPGPLLARITIGPGGYASIGAGVDALRTRCAGPSLGDVAGTPASPLAAVEVGIGQLRHRRLTLRFTRPGGFQTGAYAGQRSGTLVVRLVRASEHGGTRRKLAVGYGTKPSEHGAGA
jgi:hypothetical protein